MLEVITVSEAKRIYDELLSGVEPAAEKVGLGEALGRVCAEDIISPVDVPEAGRSTVDGWALRAKDTHGASESMPALLQVVGEVHMGSVPGFSIGPGETSKIPTGGVLPAGADAVCMVEYSEDFGDGMVGITKPVGAFENVTKAGEDIKRHSVVVFRGTRIRPQEIGALAGVGVTSIPVFARPRAAVISTGDEVVSPDAPACGAASIRDINGPALYAYLLGDGALPEHLGIVSDDRETLTDLLKKASGEYDIVLISGGSSVGTRDMTLSSINSTGSVLAHGLALRPGKPTILGVSGRVPVIGLPGHPVSAMVVYLELVRHVLARLSGEVRPRHRPSVRARITRSLASSPGRDEYVRVRLKHTDEGLFAEPVLGTSAMISTMLLADGLARIPLRVEGIAAGGELEVILL
ncbi:MAG: gephyrin-like molybdotransferase Glp [Bacillota bacterium]